MNQANQNLLHPSRQVGADLAAWRKVGGGEGLLAALADPQSIVSKLQDANLCGMGGAGFPTWRKWEAAVAAQSKHGDKYVVCNANEDEPGTFKDRVLLAKTPHQVIEGVLIAAVACRANKAIMYVNPHQTESIAAIVPAIEQWKKKRFVHPHRKLSGQTFRPEIGRNFRPLHRRRRNRRDFMVVRRFPVPAPQAAVPC